MRLATLADWRAHVDLPHRPPLARRRPCASSPFHAPRPRRRGSRRRAAAPTYRFTIVSVSATLNALRKQLYYELQALDLRVLNVRISREESDQLASTTVTLLCPPQLRGVLNAVALRLGQSGRAPRALGKRRRRRHRGTARLSNAIP